VTGICHNKDVLLIFRSTYKYLGPNYYMVDVPSLSVLYRGNNCRPIGLGLNLICLLSSFNVRAVVSADF